MKKYVMTMLKLYVTEAIFFRSSAVENVMIGILSWCSVLMQLYAGIMLLRHVTP